MIDDDKKVSITVRGKQADPQLWHQSDEPLALGCTQCPELQFCGGLGISAPIFNCLDLCCGEPHSCKKYACPNQLRYSSLVNETGGLQLNPFRWSVAPMGTIPDYVPCILDRGNLVGPLGTPVVAISLYSIIDPISGISKFSSRQELLESFKIRTDARLVITASDKDQSVEHFWHIFRSKKTAESLRNLRPAIVSTPNFSMHIDTVRHDNLISMARIAHCFETFAAGGIPVALHVNGRTQHDFNRWAGYLIKSPNIYAITYELGTVGKSSVRREWHVEQLIAMARAVPRPLTLMLRAGSAHIPELSKVFRRVIFLDTSAHMKAKKRQRARIVGGKLSWQPNPTMRHEPIDELLLDNIRISRRAMPKPVKAPFEMAQPA